MRRCVVENCSNYDQIILCHRFPKNKDLAQQWQISLNLTDYPLETLISKYTVCSQHFNCTDYRHPASNSLNFTAVPSLNCNNPRVKTKSAMMEPITLSPTNWTELERDEPASPPLNTSDSIELLQRDDDGDDATEIDESLNGSNNEDICILNEPINPEEDLIQSIDGTDFTMLDGAGCPMYMQYDEHNKPMDTTTEASTFVLGSRDSSDRPASTESDVEVLVSEGIFESQWSEQESSAVVLNAGPSNTSESAAVSPCLSYQSDLSNKTNEAGITCTDSEYGHLDRVHLIKLIKVQSATIQQLESKLATFRGAHEKLLAHFDAFRDTVCGVHM